MLLDQGGFAGPGVFRTGYKFCITHYPRSNEIASIESWIRSSRSALESPGISFGDHPRSLKPIPRRGSAGVRIAREILIARSISPDINIVNMEIYETDHLVRVVTSDRGVKRTCRNPRASLSKAIRDNCSFNPPYGNFRKSDSRRYVRDTIKA